MDIALLVDRLAEEIAEGARPPFARRRVLVDADVCLALVALIREYAQAPIAGTVSPARARAGEPAVGQPAAQAAPVPRSEAAEARARELLGQAECEAEQLRSDADAYARQVLAGLQARCLRLDAVLEEALAVLGPLPAHVSIDGIASPAAERRALQERPRGLARTPARPAFEVA